MAGEPTGRGVLRPDLAEHKFQLSRHEPAGETGQFVDNYWIVRWDLRGRPAFEQTILPHPRVNLAFEDTGAAVYGVDRGLFVRKISGHGQVLGVRFHPGGFRPFANGTVTAYTDRVVPAAPLFGAAIAETNEAIISAADEAEMVAHADRFLASVLPEPDPAVQQITAIVEQINSDAAMVRVDQVATAAGMSMRKIQRLFAEYVGVSPKWVLRRARLHDAAERADSGEHVDWAQLAADLGYADQAHLTRDFTTTIGVPPAQYASRDSDSGTAR